MFITFEGIDGCGKSTQARLLAAHLRSLGQETILSREPGGTSLAEEIRDLVLCTRGPESEEVSPRAELLLFAAARAQHIQNLIRPALERGAWVLCDRFTDSTLAYQSGGLGLDEAMVRSLNGFATQGLSPQLTLLFDVSVEEAQARRARERGLSDRIEARGLEFQKRVRHTFLEESVREPNRIVVLSAAPPEDEVHRQVLKCLERLQVLVLDTAA